jgi:hypothetical protein
MAETGAGITVSSNAGNLLVRNQRTHNNVISLANQLAGEYVAPVAYRLYGIDLEHAPRQLPGRRAVRARSRCVIL